MFYWQCPNIYEVVRKPLIHITGSKKLTTKCSIAKWYLQLSVLAQIINTNQYIILNAKAVSYTCVVWTTPKLINTMLYIAQCTIAKRIFRLKTKNLALLKVWILLYEDRVLSELNLVVGLV